MIKDSKFMKYMFLNLYRNFVYQIFMFIIFPIFLEAGQDYNYQVSIVAIFQNEAPYLKEWIEYHKLIGVEHFYLFNNFSKDDFHKVLDPYIESGEVELTEWACRTVNIKSWNDIQCQAYEHAIRMACRQSKWLAIIDLDEFIVPTNNNNLADFLADYEEYGGVCINWQIFGTSGLKKIPSNCLMIEALLWKAPDNYLEHEQVKSIVRPETVLSCKSPHFVEYKTGYFQVNANKEIFEGFQAPYVAIDKIRLNHYWSRAEDYYYSVKLARFHTKSSGKEFCENLLRDLNEELDTAILKFVPALRKKCQLTE
jgi:hypothetical protein